MSKVSHVTSLWFRHSTKSHVSLQKTTLNIILSVIWYFMSPRYFFGWHLLWRSVQMDDGWVHPLAKTLPSLVTNLWWNIVMDDWHLDEKPLGKWQRLLHRKSKLPKMFYKEWQTMLGQHLELVTLHHGLQLVLSKTLEVVTLTIMFLCSIPTPKCRTCLSHTVHDFLHCRLLTQSKG